MASRIAAFFGTPRRKTYAASVGAGYFYTAAAAVLNLALVPILLDGLGKQKFGIWLTLYALGQWVALVTTWISPAIVKRIGGHFAKKESELASVVVVTVAFGYALVGALVVVAGAAVAGVDSLEFLGGEPSADVRLGILLAAVWMAIQIQSQVRINVLSAAQRLYVVHSIQTAVVLLSGISSAVVVLAGGGLAPVAASYASGAALGFVAYRWASRRILTTRSGASGLQPAVLGALTRSAAPYALRGLASILVSSDILLLAVLTDAQRVAEYGIAYKLVEAILQLIWRVPDTTQPYVVELDALQDRPGLRRLHAIIVQTSVAIGGGAAAALFFLGHRILVVWVGAENTVGVGVIRLLAVVLFIHAFRQANLVFPFFAGQIRALVWLEVVEGLLKVLFAWVLLEAIGTSGVPLATILALGSLSVWFIPRYTMRWLEIDAGPFFASLAARSIPAVTLTTIASVVGFELFSTDSFLSLAAGLGIAGAAFAGGFFLGFRDTAGWGRSPAGADKTSGK